MGLVAVAEDALGGIEAQLTAGLEARILSPVKSHIRKLASLLEVGIGIKLKVHSPARRHSHYLPLTSINRNEMPFMNM